MAKRNSTRIATREALQSSEPRLQTFKGWAGMNIETSQRSWTPLESIPKSVNPAYNSHTSNLVYKQTDEKTNTTLIQNNLRCLANGSLETRNQELGELYNHLVNLPTSATWGYVNDVDDRIQRSYSFDDFKFTNITYLRDNWLYAVIECSVYIYSGRVQTEGGTPNVSDCIGVITTGNLLARISIANLNSGKNNWDLIKLDSRVNAEMTDDTITTPYICEYANTITCVYSCLSSLLAAGKLQESHAVLLNTDTTANIFKPLTSDLHKRMGNGLLYSDDYTDIKTVYTLSSCDYIEEATEQIAITGVGDVTTSNVKEQESWGTFWFTVNTKFGSTLFNVDSKGKATGNSIYLKVRPVNFTGSKYLKLGVTFTYDRAKTLIDKGATDIEFWFSEKGSEQCMVIGRVAFPVLNELPENEDVKLNYSFYGSMYDTDELATMSLSQPDYNSTQGPEITRMKFIDSRMYFYGSVSRPYRLYMGGTSTMELATSRGKGGGFIDCEPGSGCYITAVHKFKTQSGASIVTFLTGNKNTGQQKRYNLIETQITISSEIAENSWKYEEVTNVIGTNSYNGSLVCADGLYMLSRYGLHVTTQAMEYNSQLRSQKVSSAITPIFENRLSPAFDNAVLIYIDEVIYFIFGCEDDSEYLDHIIFCYDINTHAIYTYSYGDKNTDILNILPIDYIGWTEGIGIVTPNCIDLIPTVGDIRAPLSSQISYTIDDVEHQVSNSKSRIDAVLFDSGDTEYATECVTHFYAKDFSGEITTSSKGCTPSSTEFPMFKQQQGRYHDIDKTPYHFSSAIDVKSDCWCALTGDEIVCLNLSRINIMNYNNKRWAVDSKNKAATPEYCQYFYESGLIIKAETLSEFIDAWFTKYNSYPKLDITAQLLRKYNDKYPDQEDSKIYYLYNSLFHNDDYSVSIFLNIVEHTSFDDAYQGCLNSKEDINTIFETSKITVHSFEPLLAMNQIDDNPGYERYFFGDNLVISSNKSEISGTYVSAYDGNISPTSVHALTSGYVKFDSISTTEPVRCTIACQATIGQRHMHVAASTHLYLPCNANYDSYQITKNLDLNKCFKFFSGTLYLTNKITQLYNCKYKQVNKDYYQTLDLFDNNNQPIEELFYTNIYVNRAWDSYGSKTLGNLSSSYVNIFDGLPNDRYCFDAQNIPLEIQLHSDESSGQQIVQATQQVPLLWQTGELSTSTPAVGFLNLNQLEFHFDYLQTDKDGLKITINAVDYYGREIEVTRSFVQETEMRNYIAPLRVDAYVESYNIRMEGTASLRMTHICARVYIQGKKARQVYGHEALMHWITPNGDTDTNIRINSYNDLYRAVIP